MQHKPGLKARNRRLKPGPHGLGRLAILFSTVGRRSRSWKGGRATDSDDSEDRSSGTGGSSSNDDKSEATAAALAKNVPSSPPQRYFGDDIVLQVTKTGDVVSGRNGNNISIVVALHLSIAI